MEYYIAFISLISFWAHNRRVPFSFTLRRCISSSTLPARCLRRHNTHKELFELSVEERLALSKGADGRFFELVWHSEANEAAPELSELSHHVSSELMPVAKILQARR